MQATNYDYIFLGAGCASLSIIMRMIDSGKFPQKKILLVDKEAKTKNDRTWCFWEKETGIFEDIVYRKWHKLNFKTGDVTIPLEMDGYQYKMIRGIDFYNKCFSVIKSMKNIDIVYGEVSFEEQDQQSTIKIDKEVLEVNQEALVFNSLYSPAIKEKDKFYLLQHFKGWIIETKAGFFNDKEATLMDFRVDQKHGTTFVYLLPLSSSKALVEYTLFTKNLLPQEEYDKALRDYVNKFLMLNDYTINEEEFGIIPMTNAKFPFFKNRMYHIGTAGGQTKASTGYTFRFIQKQAHAIVKQLISRGSLSKTYRTKKRFFFYDSTFLHILYKNLMPGKAIFSRLFQKNKAAKVLKFLDNETTIAEEMKLLNCLPKKIFVKTGVIELLKMVFKRQKG